MVRRKPKLLHSYQFTSRQGRRLPRSHGITAQIVRRYAHGDGSPHIQPLGIMCNLRGVPSVPTLSGQASPRMQPNGRSE